MSAMLKFLQTPPEMIKRADVLEDVGKWMKENPLASRMLIGGGLGAVGGALFSNNQSTGRNMLLGGLLGAGGGGLYHMYQQSLAEKNDDDGGNNPPPPSPGGNTPSPGDNTPAPGDNTPAPGTPQNTPSPTGGAENTPSSPNNGIDPDLAKAMQDYSTPAGEKAVPDPKGPLMDMIDKLGIKVNNGKLIDSDYVRLNDQLPHLSWRDQILVLQYLRRNHVLFDPTLLNTIFTQNTANTFNKLKTPAERDKYVMRLLKAGMPIKQRGTYDNGKPRYIGDPNIDTKLDKFYQFNDVVRKDITGWYTDMNGLDDLLRAGEWRLKNPIYAEGNESPVGRAIMLSGQAR